MEGAGAAVYRVPFVPAIVAEGGIFETLALKIGAALNRIPLVPATLDLLGLTTEDERRALGR